MWAQSNFVQTDFIAGSSPAVTVTGGTKPRLQVWRVRRRFMANTTDIAAAVAAALEDEDLWLLGLTDEPPSGRLA